MRVPLFRESTIFSYIFRLLHFNLALPTMPASNDEDVLELPTCKALGLGFSD